MQQKNIIYTDLSVNFFTHTCTRVKFKDIVIFLLFIEMQSNFDIDL